MIDMLIAYYSNGNKALFAKKLGITPQAINGWQVRGNFDAERIYTKCEGVSGDWLLSNGEGSMLRNEGQNSAVANNHSVAAINSNVNVDESKILNERIAHLEKLLAEKERLISVLMDKNRPL